MTSPAYSADSSSGTAVPVVPHDTNTLARECRYLYVGTTGDLSFLSSTGDNVVIVGAAVGYHPIRTSRVNATDTTADNIVAFF